MSTKAGKKGPKGPPASPKHDDEATTIDELKAAFQKEVLQIKAEMNEKLDKEVLQLKAEMNGKVDTLYNVIKMKEEIIGKLQQEIGELKSSYDFLSDETSKIRGQIKTNETLLNSHAKKHEEVINKTVDLEDRSRRNNVVFFNIPEVTEENVRENCEEKITKILEEKQFFNSDYEAFIDRAHRIGPKRNQSNERPRPIIVRFTYFKDKQHVIQNGKKLKGTRIGVSEDFSKHTLEEHKHLIRHAKEAKDVKFVDPKKAILNFKVTYKRVLITYTTDKTNTMARTFTKSFSLPQILENSRWYIPEDRPSARM